MHIIANSSSNHTDWVVADGAEIILRAETDGLNPFFLTRREISHIIRLQLPETFFKRRWDHVYFYGAGCASDEKNKIVEQSLVAQFKTPVHVMSDLVGAARGMLIHTPGLVAILSTGANSCLYNGQEVVLNVRAGGYLLGDEGSKAYLGKLLLSDILKGVTPADLIVEFYAQYDTSPDNVIDEVYSAAQPSSVLSRYSDFLADHIDNPYCRQMAYDGFMQFFRRNIAFYNYDLYPLSVVGTAGITYRNVLIEAARDFGVTINKIEVSPLPGLVEYHKG